MNLSDPALTFALALVAGILAQSAARHLRVPGIVLLLLTGALLGPDGLNVVRPDTLGPGLEIIVGLSMAVILFEAGLNLHLGRLRREARVIRLLITLGAAITGVGGTMAAHFVMGWPWPIAITFGALVIVTGPTVITPLLRRVRVRRNVATVLEAEGVFIDPIGAILAVVALELALPEGGGAAHGLLGIPSRLLVGALVGVGGGLLVALLLRFRKLVPEDLQTVFTLSLVLAVFEVSETLQAETGILAAVLAGFVVANVGVQVSRELREFKEQLTVLLVGLLFVLLAADVRLASVVALGWRGLAVVLLLMFVIRPLGVAASTRGSGLSWRERAFVTWIGPRGIVAAAVASVFGERLLAAGFEVGGEFRPLVFLVIAITVVIQGFTSGPVASWLGIRRPIDHGHVIVGANALGRALAEALRDAGEDVVVIDMNATEARAAEEAGLQVIYGNANEEQVMLRADVEGRRTFVAVTSNESANVLLARIAKEDHKVPRALAALERSTVVSVTPERARGARVGLLFGAPLDLEGWMDALRHGTARVEQWRFEGTRTGQNDSGAMDPAHEKGMLPLMLVRDGRATPVGSSTRLRPGDVVTFVRMDGAGLGHSFAEGGWVRVDRESTTV